MRTIYAVTRCLEIISEASRRLPEELKARHPSIAWKQMAGAGNVYRHDYEDVAARYVWDRFSSRCRPCAGLSSKNWRVSPDTNGPHSRPTCAQLRCPIELMVVGSARRLRQADVSLGK